MVPIKKSILIPSYLHEGFLSPKKIRTRPLSACFIGNYEHYPNVDAIKWYLDRCHEAILQKIPGYRFHIIGTGAKENLAKFQVRYKKFGESVQWIGEVKDPVKEISKYEICLAPLVTGAGFRGKVLQYSALGKATVSTSIGTSGMPFIHGKSVLVADSELDFSAHVLTLLRNEKLRYRLAKKAQEISLKKYVWSSNIVSILTRLKKI